MSQQSSSNINVFFISGLIPEALKNEIATNSKGGVQYAADAFQWNFVRGLDKHIAGDMIIVNAPFVGSYPLFYKRPWIGSLKFCFGKIKEHVSVGFLNIAIVKNYFIERALIKALNQWRHVFAESTNYIVVYSMHKAWMDAAIKIKKAYPKTKLCLIVPDLPEYLSTSTSLMFKLRDAFKSDLYPLVPYFDSFVFMTNAMADHFKVTDKPWVKIEGMINPEEATLQAVIKKSGGKKILLYTGTLAEKYGILDLLNAFKMIDKPDYELWICGDGNTQEIVQENARKDPRVKYLGLIPRERVLELQREVTVLINPRNDQGEYTKYSFPSKIMEYFLSGTPCMMYPLPGISASYEPYYYAIEGAGIASIKDKIVEVCEKDPEELYNFGVKAKAYVLKNKHYLVQTKKLADMLVQ